MNFTEIYIKKKTDQISSEKVLALVSSEYFTLNDILDEGFLKTTTGSSLTMTAPFCILSFIESFSEPNYYLTELQKFYIKFIQNIIKNDLNNEDEDWNENQFWENASETAKYFNLNQLLEWIKEIYNCLDLNLIDFSSEEQIFLYSLWCFSKFGNHPFTAIEKAKTYGINVKKLTIDMCMAFYGISWILLEETEEFLNNHKQNFCIIVE
jgi:hypothetical protein